jgi:hypothetical protein
MRVFNTLRAMLFALFLCVIPATASAGVFISVGFAPPVLPIYVQPPCPEPGLMWTPGFWAYGPDGYYWVPGTWVPAPYIGALWTPPYWGWDGGLFVFHTGYWGPHVGYYGGVNYGFGYGGIGFAGGAWHGHDFAYNTAVVNVNRTVIHNTYVDNTVVRNNTIVNDRHVAYSGGPGGINHQPTAEENAYSHEQHQAATSMQTQHETAAMHNTNNYASRNGGHPTNAAVERPAGGGNQHESMSNNAPRNNPGNGAPTKTYNSSHSNTGNAPAPRTYNASHSNTSNAPEQRTYNASHSNTSNAPEHQGGGQPPPHPAPQPHESHQPPPRENEHGHR